MYSENSQSEISDAFLASKVKDDQQSLQVLEDTINSLNDQQSTTVDKQLINWNEDINDEFLASAAVETLQTNVIPVQQPAQFSTSEISILNNKNLRSHQNFDQIKQFLLPILTVSQISNQTHFCTALRILGPINNKTTTFLINQLTPNSQALKDLIPALLSTSDGQKVFQTYSLTPASLRVKFLQYIDEFLSTANYFLSLPIYIGDVKEYQITPTSLTFSKQLYDLYKLQAKTEQADYTPFQQNFEKFIFNELKQEINSQIFCQLLLTLKNYISNFTISRPNDFLKLLIFQSKRVTATSQITSLIVVFLLLTAQYGVSLPDFENFIKFLLSATLDKQNVKAIKLAILKLKKGQVPEIDQSLQNELINSNFIDFLPLFTVCRHAILTSLEHGNFHYLKIIPQFARYCTEEEACRAFSSLLVKLKSELVFVQKLKISVSLKLLLGSIRQEVLQESFNDSVILENVNPQNLENVKEIYKVIKIEDLQFIRNCELKAAFLYCLHDQKFVNGNGFEEFMKLETREAEKYYKLFEK